jgi:hypothetical protein
MAYFVIPPEKQDSLVGTAKSYRLDGQGLIPGRGRKMFSSPLCPDQLWGPPSLLANG